ncbi:MAG: cellulose biosynthesis cyclic di-GMP-binding regulatory protein BcsB [Azospirillaceae bacterium]
MRARLILTSVLAGSVLAGMLTGTASGQEIPLPGQGGGQQQSVPGGSQTGQSGQADQGTSGVQGQAGDTFLQNDSQLIPLPLDLGPAASGPAQQPGGFPAQTVPGPATDSLLGQPQGQSGTTSPASAPAESLVRLFPTWGQREIENGRLLIQGEEVNVGFDANLLVAPQGASRLILEHQSGVDLLPERSRIEVIVNNRSIGALQLGAFNQERRSEFTVPAGILQRGRNEVTLRGYQAHRVICGPQAGWELWTAIDLGASGIAGVGGDMPTGQLSTNQLGQIVEQITAADRTIPVRFASQPSSAADLGGAIGFASWVGATLYHRSPVFEWQNGPVTGDLQVLVDPARMDPISIQRSASGRVTITLGRIDSDGIITLLNDTVDRQDDGRLVATSSGVVSAVDLGLSDYDIRTHRSVYNLAFRLPSNMVIENDIRGDLILDAAYAAGMPAEAQFTFLVNGVPVRTRPLDNPQGEIVEGERHPIPFRLLNGGINTISIVTTIPAANPDAACPAVTVDTPPFASIFNSTRLELPETVPAIVYPELANFANAASPHSILPNDAGVLAISSQSGATVAAAMTVVSRLAATNGQPLNFEVADLERLQTPRPTLVVAPIDRLQVPSLDLQPQLFTAMRSALTPVALAGGGTDQPGQSVQDLVRDLENRVSNNIGAAGQDVTRLTNAAPSSTSQRDWLELLGGGGSGPGILPWFEQSYLTVRGILESAGSGIGLSLVDENLASWVAAQGRAAGIVLSYVGGERQLITIVTAADGPSLNIVAGDLVRDDIWREIGGDATVLLAATASGSGGVQVHTPTARRLFLVDEVAPESMRNLAGQLFSLDPALWLAVVFILVVVGAALSHVLVRRIGVRTKDGT